MVKTTTFKKTTKTAPLSNCGNLTLALDNPSPKPPNWDKPDMVKPVPCHTEKTPTGSLTATILEPQTQGNLGTAWMRPILVGII